MGIAGYRGVHNCEEAQGPHWHMAMQPGKQRQLDLPHQKGTATRAGRTTEGEHPGQARASKPVSTQEGPLQGPGQEHGAVVQLVRPGEPGDCQEVAVDPPCPRCVLSALRGLRRGAKRPQSCCATVQRATDWLHVDVVLRDAQHARQCALISASLSLWARAKLHTAQDMREGKGRAKELADVLVVFGDDVIIFSDKHIAFQEDKDLTIAWPRWFKRAVTESAKQLHGAMSWLRRWPDRIFLDAGLQAAVVNRSAGCGAVSVLSQRQAQISERQHLHRSRP